MSPEVRADDDLTEAAYRMQMSISRLARRLRHEVHAGLTPSQLSALSTVSRRGPLTLGELAELERVAPPSVTRMVTNLENDGYVERVPDPADRRVVRVVATAKADEFVAVARARKAAWLIERLEALPAGERGALLGAVGALERLADTT